MTANRSLDEFGDARAGGDDDVSGGGSTAEPSGASVSADAEGEAPGADEPTPRKDEPAPPSSTYVWTPGGDACEACGETAEARWRDGDELVCAGCKAW